MGFEPPSRKTPTALGSLALTAVEFGKQYGLEPSALLMRAGLPLGLTAADRVPSESLLALWCIAAEESCDEFFGLHAGERFVSAQSVHVVGFAARTAATLADSYAITVELATLTNEGSRIKLARGESGLGIELGPADGLPEWPRVYSEMALAAYLCTGRKWSMKDIWPTAVEFQHAAPARLDEYHRLFGVTPTFGAPTNRLTFDSATMALPLVESDPALNQYLKNQAITQLTLGTSGAGTDDVAEFKAGDVLLGKLEVVSRLGEGGIGAIYEVEHRLTRHRRALKVLHPRFQADRALVERSLREASAAGRIDNPHIVECFDAGRLESGAPYILMELLHGESLKHRLRRQGRLSASETVDVVLQTAEALSAAHRAGIVHRDLKPDNLFIVQREGRPFVKVVDFGVSKFDPVLTGGNDVTATGIAMGTPLYMAPEQMRGVKDLDARADLYALGIIAYECLAATVPYAGDSFAELASVVMNAAPKPLGVLRPDLPAGLCAAVHRAFARDRADRFPAVDAFAAELLPFQHGGSALPPGPLSPRTDVAFAPTIPSNPRHGGKP